VWDAPRQLGVNTSSTVRVRVVASDNDGVAPAGQTGNFTLGNAYVWTGTANYQKRNYDWFSGTLASYLDTYPPVRNAFVGLQDGGASWLATNSTALDGRWSLATSTLSGSVWVSVVAWQLSGSAEITVSTASETSHAIASSIYSASATSVALYAYDTGLRTAGAFNVFDVAQEAAWKVLQATGTLPSACDFMWEDGHVEGAYYRSSETRATLIRMPWPVPLPRARSTSASISRRVAAPPGVMSTRKSTSAASAAALGR
jgi:hypothetical protein